MKKSNRDPADMTAKECARMVKLLNRYAAWLVSPHNQAVDRRASEHVKHVVTWATVDSETFMRSS